MMLSRRVMKSYLCFKNITLMVGNELIKSVTGSRLFYTDANYLLGIQFSFPKHKNVQYNFQFYLKSFFF